MVLDPVASSLAPTRPRWSQASQEAAILLYRGHQGIKMSSRVSMARAQMLEEIKVRLQPNRERVDLVVLCRKRQGVGSPQWTMVVVDNGLGTGSNIAPSSSCAEGNDAAVKASKCRPEFQWLEHRYWNGE